MSKPGPMEEGGIPIAWGQVKGDFFVVEHCPYCGRKHTHGPGYRKVRTENGDYGWRIEHCEGKRPPGLKGYLLRERPRATAGGSPGAEETEDGTIGS